MMHRGPYLLWFRVRPRRSSSSTMSLVMQAARSAAAETGEGSHLVQAEPKSSGLEPGHPAHCRVRLHVDGGAVHISLRNAGRMP